MRWLESGIYYLFCFTVKSDSYANEKKEYRSNFHWDKDLDFMDAELRREKSRG